MGYRARINRFNFNCHKRIFMQKHFIWKHTISIVFMAIFSSFIINRYADVVIRSIDVEIMSSKEVWLGFLFYGKINFYITSSKYIEKIFTELSNWIFTKKADNLIYFRCKKFFTQKMNEKNWMKITQKLLKIEFITNMIFPKAISTWSMKKNAN